MLKLSWFASACMLFLVLIGSANGLRHHLSIHNDDRTIFKIETFGFVQDGKMRVKISDFSLHFSAKEMDDYKQVISTSDNNHTLNSEITVTKYPAAQRLDPTRANATLLANPPSNVRRSLQSFNVPAKPVAQIPVVPQTGVATPPVTQLTAGQTPVTQVPVAQRPVTPGSVVPAPVTTLPAGVKTPVIQVPAAQRPGTPGPTAQAPVSQTPAAQKPATQGPGAQTPGYQTAAPKTTAGQSTTTTTTTQPPVAKPPVTQAPVLGSRAPVTQTQAPPAVPAVPAAPVVMKPNTTATTHPVVKANSTHSKPAGAEKKAPFYLVGFLLRHATSESAAQADVERIVEKRQCILEHIKPYDVFIDLSDPETWKESIELTHFVSAESIGLYSLIFARCYPSGTHYVSFKLEATFHNPGPDYLSAGDTPLPSMYFAFFVAFTLALFVWVWVLQRDTATNGRVHYIHYMMLILLVLKCLSLFFEGVRYHYISIYGVSELWSVVYYVFAFLKGVMMFTVILLIGSGWSLMKSYLNDKEKRIVWVVLVLQVLDNIAMIVLEESAPGSQGWLTWRDILHLVDIVCCCAILLPIVWSIRHLRQAAEVDGKAHNSLQKLQLFRQFYVMVVVYVYFTRIVVYILSSTVPFYLLWLGPLSTEIATFLFFTITGYKFRPAPDNPYLPVSSEDQEGAEYGLEEGEQHGVQLTAPPSRNKTSKK